MNRTRVNIMNRFSKHGVCWDPRAGKQPRVRKHAVYAQQVAFGDHCMGEIPCTRHRGPVHLVNHSYAPNSAWNFDHVL